MVVSLPAYLLNVAALFVVWSHATQVTVDFLPEHCRDPKVSKLRHGLAASVILNGSFAESTLVGTPGHRFAERTKENPLEIVLGRKMVPAGLELGLEDMCVGERRTLLVPPKIHDESKDSHEVERFPSLEFLTGATATFTVELIGIGTAVSLDEDGKPINVFSHMDADGDKKLTRDEMHAWFQTHSAEMPEHVFPFEDRDGDGYVSWDEFSGQKGESPEEL